MFARPPDLPRRRILATVDALADLRARRPDLAALPVVEFAFPGPLRDRIVSAVLSGTKTTTCSLLLEYDHAGEALPAAGERGIVVDSDEQPVAVMETIAVAPMRLDAVDLPIAVAEGERFTTVAQWRAAHEAFWTSQQFRAEIGQPGFAPADDTIVVVQRFDVVERV
jgi:uncharacterized protein YhfF